MTLHAITVLGHDRPGIIAETTERLADLGLNLEDSTMTLLRGHFAMMLVGAGDASGRLKVVPHNDEGVGAKGLYEHATPNQGRGDGREVGPGTFNYFNQVIPTL